MNASDSEAEILKQLERIGASTTFPQVDRLKRFVDSSSQKRLRDAATSSKSTCCV